MEGGGVYTAAQRELTHWIVAKGIRDWGMGKNDEYQRVAARNSVDFVYHALRQDAFAAAIRDHVEKLTEWLKK